MKKNLNKSKPSGSKKKSAGKKKDNLPVGFSVPKGIEIYHSSRPTTLDKLRAYYFQGKPLTAKLEYLKRVYEYTNSLLLDGNSRQQTVEILKKTLPAVSQGHAYEYVRTTIDLFGDVHASNKKGLRYMLLEDVRNTYKRAVLAGDIREQNIAIKTAAQIGGVIDSEDGFDYKSLVLHVPVFTSNPEVLKQQQTIDIDTDEE